MHFVSNICGLQPNIPPFVKTSIEASYLSIFLLTATRCFLSPIKIVPILTESKVSTNHNYSGDCFYFPKYLHAIFLSFYIQLLQGATIDFFKWVPLYITQPSFYDSFGRLSTAYNIPLPVSPSSGVRQGRSYIESYRTPTGVIQLFRHRLPIEALLAMQRRIFGRYDSWSGKNL